MKAMTALGTVESGGWTLLRLDSRRFDGQPYPKRATSDVWEGSLGCKWFDGPAEGVGGGCHWLGRLAGGQERVHPSPLSQQIPMLAAEGLRLFTRGSHQSRVRWVDPCPATLLMQRTCGERDRTLVGMGPWGCSMHRLSRWNAPLSSEAMEWILFGMPVAMR